MKRFAALAFLHLALAAGAGADLANPSTLTIRELEPSRFAVELTLPVISGRVVKARPVIPDVCRVEGEPEVQGDARKAIRTWTMTCDPEELVGATVGIQGLLGTALDVLLTLETLDGRQHVRQLRATQAYFVIPPPPTLVELALSAGRRGVERVLRRPELAVVVLIAVLVGTRRRALLAAVVAFSVAQGLGQWLAGQSWMVMSLFLPQVVAAGIAWLVGVELMGSPVLRPGWWRPLAASMLVLGALYGAAQPETVPSLGLSTGEQSLSLLLFATGAIAGLLLLVLCIRQLQQALVGLPDGVRERWTYRVAYVSVVLAGALFFYRATAPIFTGGVDPVVPLVSLAAAAALALWLRRKHGAAAIALAVFAAVLFAAGLIVSLQGALFLPLAALAAYGLLAVIGARLMLAGAWPTWLVSVVVAVTALYQGYHAGQVLGHEAALPVANAAGMGVLVAAVFLVFYQALPAGDDSGRPSLRVPGFLALGLAALWQLADHREWLAGPVATDFAMGIVRLPVLAVVLILVSWLLWPRRRRFAPQPGTEASGAHLILLGLAFFILPLGTLRVDIPFHSPDAPSAAQAGRVMDTLLTDAYLAFNLDDEDAAFDRLARNLSEELVADVYLDSRRRLTAGTREGAEVTVRDVAVTEVGDAIGTEGTAFTYPCQWAVTARVRHLQHIHNRQNVYSGELTLRVEDDRWKISGLELLSEERVVLSWRDS